MNHLTFSRKVGVSIAAATLTVTIAVCGFVYLTFKHWTENQRTALLDAKLERFELQIGEPQFLPSLLQPGAGKGVGAAAVLKPDLSAFASDLDEGQRLEMLDSEGRILAEVGSAKSGFDGSSGSYQSETALTLPAYGYVTLRLTDTVGSVTATAEREVGRLLLLGLSIAAVMAAVAGTLVSRSALSPIRRMIREVRGIRAENLSRRLHLPPAKDELYQLGETFNDFLGKLDASFERQRRFVADASHELKTPLAIIEGHTHMIQRWGKQSPEVLDESLAYMMNETGRMKDLIAQLLLLAEAEASVDETKREMSDLKETLRELLPQAVHVAPDVTLDYDADSSPEPVLVRMPSADSYRALRNIVENALKYTPAHGTVKIRHDSENGQVVVTVEDTGVGISAEQLPHVFDRFYRTEDSRNRNEGGGSGLGLAIVKTIMERHGGSIALESEPGKGTKAILRYVRIID